MSGNDTTRRRVLKVAGDTTVVALAGCMGTEDGGGPQSGFVTEEMSEQTHNVIASLPEGEGYSPLWAVSVYDNTDFDDGSDLESATAATVLDTDTATVNWPIVSAGME